MARWSARPKARRAPTKRSTKKRSEQSRLLKLAHDMGKVERGLRNPESKISLAHKRGCTPPDKKPKRTLY